MTILCSQREPEWLSPVKLMTKHFSLSAPCSFKVRKTAKIHLSCFAWQRWCTWDNFSLLFFIGIVFVCAVWACLLVLVMSGSCSCLCSCTLKRIYYFLWMLQFHSDMRQRGRGKEKERRRGEREFISYAAAEINSYLQRTNDCFGARGRAKRNKNRKKCARAWPMVICM